MKQTVGVFVVVAAVACAPTVRAVDAPRDEAARRAAVAKLGRLAWANGRKPLAFCDLDGGDVVTSDAVEVGFVRWLPDHRRVFAIGDRRGLVVDSVTGKTTDLGADESYARFQRPRLSPDGHFVVSWRTESRSNSKLPVPVAYTVFDLDGGAHTDIGPLEPYNHLIRSGSGTPWWSPKSELYAVVSAPRQADEPKVPRYRLVRWAPHDRSTAVVAELPRGTQVREMAFHGERFAYVVAPETDNALVPVVRADDGSSILELPAHHLVWGLRWEEDGAALRLGVNRLGGISPEEPRSYFLRVEPGRPAEQIAEFEPPPRAPIDGGWIEERRAKVPRAPDRDHTASELWRVSASGEATKIGLGSAPRRVGDVVVFWRAAAPTTDARGRDVEMPLPSPGHGDLWAYDPKDGAQIRLTTCGFDTRCWDIAVTPPASRAR